MIAALAALVAACSGDSFTLNMPATALLFAGLSSAWSIIGGFGGQFSLTHSVFFAAGAYTTADLYLKAGVSPWFGLLPSAILAAALACLLSWPVFRLRGPFLAIATMAFTEVALGNYMEWLTGGPRGMSIPFRLGFANMIYLAEYGIEKLVRDLRVHQVLEGTNEIMRLIVARSMIGR